MNLVSTERELSFEITFDSSTLDVGMSIYDDSGVSPVLVLGPVSMDNVVGNLYRAKFTPEFGKSYLVFKAVYLDNTFTTLNTDYNSGSESFVCEKAIINDGQIVVRKNKPLNAFTIVMLDSVNQNPTAGLTVTAMRSKDGASFASCDNPVAPIGNGFYKINLTANDLNADVVALNFAAFGADNTVLTILTQA